MIDFRHRRHRCALSLLLLSAAGSILSANAGPRFLVLNGRPKCITAEVPKMTLLKIHYEAPDLNSGKNAHGDAPTYITLLERPVEPIGDNQLDPHRRKPKLISQHITDTSGSFVQRIFEDSAVDVCVRASAAGQKNPMMFHLRLEGLGDELTEMEKEDKASGAEHHWTFLETQIERIEHEVYAIIAEADFFKERDAIYHQQTDDLHKATLFWPILHIGILLLTGFTQANHIVRFFKQRHII